MTLYSDHIEPEHIHVIPMPNGNIEITYRSSAGLSFDALTISNAKQATLFRAAVNKAVDLFMGNDAKGLR